MRFFLLIFGLVGTVNASELCSDSTKKEIYKFDFEDMFQGLRGVEAYDEESISIVPDPVNKDAKALRFTVKSGNLVNNGNRSELKVSEYLKGDYIFHYSVSFLLPSDYVSEGEWQLFTQWLVQPNWAEGQTWKTFPGSPPPVGMFFEDDSIFLTHRPEKKKPMYSEKIKIERDVWYTANFAMRWSLDKDGWISGSVNGIPLKRKSDGSEMFTGPNMYNPEGNYFKFGIYRGRDADSTSSIYFKDVSIHIECMQSKKS